MLLATTTRPVRARPAALLPASHATAVPTATTSTTTHTRPTVALGRADGAHGVPAVQGGFLDSLLGAVGPGLLGAASSALSGDSKGALSQVRSTGASAAPMLAQQGAGALGGLVGGTAGQAISSLGAPLGQGLAGVVSGESTPGQAAGGLLSAAQPMLLQLLMSMLQK